MMRRMRMMMSRIRPAGEESLLMSGGGCNHDADDLLLLLMTAMLSIRFVAALLRGGRARLERDPKMAVENMMARF